MKCLLTCNNRLLNAVGCLMLSLDTRRCIVQQLKVIWRWLRRCWVMAAMLITQMMWVNWLIDWKLPSWINWVGWEQNNCLKW